MSISYIRSARVIVALVVISSVSMRAFPQAGRVEPQIRQAIDDTKRTVLSGNRHPLLDPSLTEGRRPQARHGPHELVLKRSPVQEKALETLLAKQQERFPRLSPMAHATGFRPAIRLIG